MRTYTIRDAHHRTLSGGHSSLAAAEYEIDREALAAGIHPDHRAGDTLELVVTEDTAGAGAGAIVAVHRYYDERPDEASS